jgi:hypothetical protein
MEFKNDFPRHEFVIQVFLLKSLGNFIYHPVVNFFQPKFEPKRNQNENKVIIIF